MMKTFKNITKKVIKFFRPRQLSRNWNCEKCHYENYSFDTECRRCNDFLPKKHKNLLSESKRINLPVIGWKGHGKTTFMNSLTLMLDQMVYCWPDFIFITADAESEAQRLSIRKQGDLGGTPNHTRFSGSHPYELILEDMEYWGSYSLVFKDFSGSCFDNMNIDQNALDFLNASSVCFMFISLEDLKRQQKQETVSSQPEPPIEDDVNSGQEYSEYLKEKQLGKDSSQSSESPPPNEKDERQDLPDSDVPTVDAEESSSVLEGSNQDESPGPNDVADANADDASSDPDSKELEGLAVEESNQRQADPTPNEDDEDLDLLEPDADTPVESPPTDLEQSEPEQEIEDQETQVPDSEVYDQFRPYYSMEMLLTTYLKASSAAQSSEAFLRQKLIVILTKGDQISDLPPDLSDYLSRDNLAAAIHAKKFNRPDQFTHYGSHRVEEYLSKMHSIDRSIREWLMTQNSGRIFINLANKKGIDLRFSIISATGGDLSSIDGASWCPRRVLDPLFWVFDDQNQRKAGKKGT